MADTNEEIGFQRRFVETRGAPLALVAEEKSFNSTKPVALMLHGALRNGSVLYPWVRLLDTHFDVVFVDLPGHGSSPAIEEVGLETFTTNIGDAVHSTFAGREVVVIGESLGGLIALAMGDGSIAEVRAVIGADPPLATRKLYHIAQAMRGMMAQEPANTFLADFSQSFYGVRRDGILEERLYYHVFGALKVPALVLTGDFLLPPVPMPSQGVPCLMDHVDRYIIEQLFPGRAEIKIVPDCGHLMLIDAIDPCKEHILTFCAPLLETAPVALAKAG